ncbi:MAG: DUF859 family phage minor structural protein [Eubacteriales bacterium]|nr:DUF859 family phage minor structural protein [Eubacteriales bacterium]
MAYQNLGTFDWGTGPHITGSVAYDYRRSGADMQYKVKVTIDPVYGTSYFGFPIYATIKLDSTTKVSAHKVKDISPSKWTSAIVYETDWLTVAGKTSGTTSLSVNLYCHYSEDYRDETYSYSLYVVPAASAMTFSGFTMGSDGNITVTRAVSSYTHTVTYQFGNAAGTIADKSSDTSINWMPPLDLARQVPNTTSGTGTLTIETYNGSTRIGSKEYDFTLYVPSDIQPEAALSVNLRNDNAVIDGWGVCVKGYTKLQYAVTASGAYGSSIRSCQFDFAGKTATGLSGTVEVNSAGSFVPRVKVADSRGRSVTVTGDGVTVYDYSEPTIGQLSVQRCNANGAAENEGVYIHIQGAFAVGADIGGRNSVTAIGHYREIGGTWSGDTVIEHGDAVIGGSLLATKSYEVEITVTDSVGGHKTVSVVIPTAEVTFHLREGGKGAGFGKYAEKEALQCAWDAEFDGDMAIAGDLTVGGKTLLNMIYPVGSIYMSANNVSPQTFFGGTWERIKDTFLLAAGDTYAAGATGGEAAHTLTVDEMPSHNHDIAVYQSGSTDVANGLVRQAQGQISTGLYVRYRGGNQSHNNMPPYLAVYIWKRTA